MAASPEFVDFATELFAPLGTVAAKRMFSGAGLFCQGVMFALIVDDVLYLKADPEFQKDFAALGSGAFTYEKQGRKIALNFWQMPAECIDDAEKAVEWGRRALKVARALKAAAPPPATRRPASAAGAAARRRR